MESGSESSQPKSKSETLCFSRKEHMGIAAFLFVLRTLLAVEQLIGQHDVEVLPDPRCHLQDGLLLVVLARRFRFVRRLGSATGGKNFSSHKKCSSLIKMCKKKKQHVIRTDIFDRHFQTLGKICTGNLVTASKFANTCKFVRKKLVNIIRKQFSFDF
jgi:hypothetical protein